MARSRSLRHQRLTSAQSFIPSIVQRRSPLIAIDRHWLISDRLSNRLVRELPVEAARHIIGAIGAVRPGMANLTRSVLSKVMAYAIETGSRRDNPFAGLKPYRLGTYHTWTDAEIAQFERRWPLGTRERLAALLLYTGQRGGDVVKMVRSDIVDARIRVAQDKTRKGTINELLLPIHPALARALQAGPIVGMQHIITDARGKPLRAITGLIER